MKDIIQFISIMLFVSFFFAACNKEGDPKENCCLFISTDITIYYKEKNLINESSNSLTEKYPSQEIEVFYKEGGELKKTSNSNNYKVVEAEKGGFYLKLFASDIYDGDFSETVIKLNDNTEDVMKCKFDFSGSNIVCTDIWYDGELVWQSTDGVRTFEIIK